MKRYFQKVKIPHQCFLWTLGLTLGNMGLNAQSVHPGNAVAQIVQPMETEGWFKFNKEVSLRSVEDINLYKEEFGLGAKDQLKMDRELRDQLGQVHKRYDQYFNGVKVHGGEFVVHEKDGKLSLANGYLVKDLKINTQPTINESKALNVALESINAKSYMWEVPQGDQLAKLFGGESRSDYLPKGELVIMHPHVLFGKSKKTHLAYAFLIHAAEPSSVKWVYVDAHDGNVILERDDIHEINTEGKAKTKFAGERKITTDHYPGGFRLRETRGDDDVHILTLNMNRKEGLDSVTEFNDADNYWDNVNAYQDEEAGDIHWGQEICYDYFKGVHDWNSIDNEGHPLVAFGNWGVNVFNAQSGGFGPGGMQATRYGNGTGTGGLTMLDVVGHEVTHSLVAFTARLGATYVAGSLNESFADIFGVSMSFWAGLPEDKIWILSDQVGAIRDMSNPKSLGAPDTWKGEFWSPSPQVASVHRNANVQDHWYYLLAVGGSGVNDNGDAYNVTPIGVKKAEKIAFRSLTVYLTSTSQYPETRAGSLQAAEDLFGIDSDEYEAVANAWYAVGVGPQVSPFDVGLVEILSPNSTCDLLTDKEEVKVKLKYYGGKNTLAAGAKVPMAYQINMGDTILDTLTLASDLEGGNTADFTFGQKADLFQAGTYNIKAWTLLDTDPNGFNNSTEKEVITFTGPKNDVGVSGIVSPLPGTIVLGASEVVRVRITNFSCYNVDPGEKIKTEYQLNDGVTIFQFFELEDTLGAGESIVVEFSQKADFTIADFITLKSRTNNLNDPVAPNNETSAAYGIIKNFPYAEDFESGTGGWLSEELKGTDVWELGTPSQGVLNSASSGKNAWMTDLDANHPDLSKMVLVSPAFDFSELEVPLFCFDLLFHTEQDWDAMVVEYATNDSTWQKLMMPGYNSFNNEGTTVTIDQPWYSGTNNKWTKNCIKLPFLKGKPTVWFRFHFESDDATNDEGVAIDNVSVMESDAYDLAVTELIGPSNGDLGSSETIKIAVANYGIKESFDVQLSYQVNNGAFIKEDTSLTIPFEDTVEFSFLTKADFSARGGYLINASVSVADDGDPTNDTLRESLVINNRPIKDFPYLQTFDGFSEGNTILSDGFVNEVAEDNRDWIAQKESAFSPVAGATKDHTSGTGLFLGSDLVGNKGDEKANYLTPRFNVSDLDNPMVEFWYQVYDEDGVVSVDVIDSMGHKDVVVFGSGQKDNKWNHAVISLNRFGSPVQLRFKNNINGSAYSLAGIDDFGVRDFELIDAALVSINAPKSTSCLGMETVSLGIKNLGSLDITEFDLELMVSHDDTTFTIEESVTDTSISSVATYVHTLGSKVDLSRLGEYTLTAKVILEDDQLLTNNTMVYEVENESPVSEFPFEEGFGEFDLNMPTNLINGWANASDHDIDWRVAKSTPSSGTGPSKDHGLDTNFIYVEASGNFNKTAVLMSPCFDVTDLNVPVLEFWVHMYGATMGNLQLDIYDGTWNNNVWNLSGDQGDKWHRVQLPLAAFGSQVKLRFTGVTGPSFRSDIALDDIQVVEGSTQTDVALLSVVSPRSGCVGEDEKVSIEVYNYSASAIVSGSLNYSYQLDGNPQVNEVLNETIEANSSKIIEFSNSISLSEGLHKLELSLTLAGDIDSTNNSLVHEFYSYDNKLFEDASFSKCLGEVIPLDLKAPGIISWEWTPGNNGNPIFFATEAGVYKATVKYENGCETTDSVELIFNSLPEPVLDSGSHCDPYVLDPGNFESYLWQNGDTTETFEARETALYFVTVSNDLGCYATTSSMVSIVKMPSAKFTYTNSGFEFTFTPVEIDSFMTYTWDFGDGMQSNEIIPVHMFSAAGTYKVVLKISSKNDLCIAEEEEVIVVTGLDQLGLDNSLKAYPNPGEGQFTIDLTSNIDQKLNVRVTDNLGRDVINEWSFNLTANASKQFKIDLTGMDKGIYLLQIKDEKGEIAYKKLMVQ